MTAFRNGLRRQQSIADTAIGHKRKVTVTFVRQSVMTLLANLFPSYDLA